MCIVTEMSDFCSVARYSPTEFDFVYLEGTFIRTYHQRIIKSELRMRLHGLLVIQNTY